MEVGLKILFMDLDAKKTPPQVPHIPWLKNTVLVFMFFVVFLKKWSSGSL